MWEPYSLHLLCRKWPLKLILVSTINLNYVLPKWVKREVAKTKIRRIWNWHELLWRIFKDVSKKYWHKVERLTHRIYIRETPRLKKMRTECIYKIRKYRKTNKNIVYLDKTRYNFHDGIKKKGFIGWHPKMLLKHTRKELLFCT